jgi:hypothetical protein
LERWRECNGWSMILSSFIVDCPRRDLQRNRLGCCCVCVCVWVEREQSSMFWWYRAKFSFL